MIWGNSKTTLVSPSLGIVLLALSSLTASWHNFLLSKTQSFPSTAPSHQLKIATSFRPCLASSCKVSGLVPTSVNDALSLGNMHITRVPNILVVSVGSTPTSKVTLTWESVFRCQVPSAASRYTLWDSLDSRTHICGQPIRPEVHFGLHFQIRMQPDILVVKKAVCYHYLKYQSGIHRVLVGLKRSHLALPPSSRPRIRLTRCTNRISLWR